MMDVFEKTGLIGLLCSPSELSRAWTGSDRVENVRANVAPYLEALGFSEAARDEAVTLMKTLFDQRAFFQGVADQMMASTYSGEEPHPPFKDAKVVMSRLRSA